MPMLKLYEQLADWWPLLSPTEDYEEEADFFIQALRDAGAAEQGTLVEFGSGGGSNAFYLKEHFTLTLLDISTNMLAVSQALNPTCEHLVGDMRTTRLGRTFDVVFIHDAIDYMTTEADLRQAMETSAIHCKPGGVAMFVPDFVRESFESDTEEGGADDEERSLRYLEWTFDPDPTDSTYTSHYVFMLREGDSGDVLVEHDPHVCGLFPRDLWLSLLTDAGFKPNRLVDDYGRDVFVAVKS